jgi:hypothetical protein
MINVADPIMIVWAQERNDGRKEKASNETRQCL